MPEDVLQSRNFLIGAQAWVLDQVQGKSGVVGKFGRNAVGLNVKPMEGANSA